MLKGALSAQEKELNEYQVKAAFLYNFVKFVEWPENSFSDPGAPIKFCILGEDPFGRALDAVRDKTVSERRILINRFKNVHDIKACHILFISASEKSRLPFILRSIENSSILTVGDMEAFARSGGIINFITIDNRIRFEINADAAQRVKLKISSQLLKLARTVKD